MLSVPDLVIFPNAVMLSIALFYLEILPAVAFTMPGLRIMKALAMGRNDHSALNQPGLLTPRPSRLHTLHFDFAGRWFGYTYEPLRRCTSWLTQFSFATGSTPLDQDTFRSLGRNLRKLAWTGSVPPNWAVASLGSLCPQLVHLNLLVPSDGKDLLSGRFPRLETLRLFFFRLQDDIIPVCLELFRPEHSPALRQARLQRSSVGLYPGETPFETFVEMAFANFEQRNVKLTSNIGPPEEPDMAWADEVTSTR